MKSSRWLLSLGLALVQCSSPPSSTPMDSSTDTDLAPEPDAQDVVTDTPEPPPPMMCRSGITWNGQSPLFRSDAASTAAWGLADARGVNLAVGDLDNDGYPDLIVMDGSTNRRTNLTANPPVRQTQVFMNRPRTSGPGRMFVDATQSSNFLVAREGPAYGRVVNLVAFADVDNDNDLDAYTGVYVNAAATAPEDPGDRSTIMLNDGRGVFSLGPISDASPPVYEDIPVTSGLAFTDQNRDGNIDLFVGFFYDEGARIEIGRQHELYQGNGMGGFTSATQNLGLMLSDQMSSFTTAGQRRPLYGVAACDVNNDGRQDLLGMAYGRQWNLLYVNQGNTYQDVSLPSGVGGDANRDYTTDHSYQCFCQANPTHQACIDVPPPAPRFSCSFTRGWRPGYNDQPWRLNGNTFSMSCGDIDNDGDLDIYTGEIWHPDVGTASDRSELLRNESTATEVRFTRPGAQATGLIVPNSPLNPVEEGGLSTAMWDFDADGRLDIWLGASDYPGQFGWLYHQKTDGTFEEVGAAAGFHHACPHGVALADFDLDGDVDMIVGSSTFRDCARQWPRGPELRVYESTAAESQANWTSIRLIGRGTGGANTSAIGATVRVTTGSVTQTREVQGTYGHFGLGQELTAHFGLANNCMIDRLEIRWPDSNGTVETFTNVVANYRLEIRQGENRINYIR